MSTVMKSWKGLVQLILRTMKLAKIRMGEARRLMVMVVMMNRAGTVMTTLMMRQLMMTVMAIKEMNKVMKVVLPIFGKKKWCPITPGLTRSMKVMLMTIEGIRVAGMVQLILVME